MSVLPVPSFLDDVKEKGLKKAIFEGADEVMERLTAGLNIQDLREALRGEAPSRRPNPRLTPHADGFWLHMRPSYYHRDMVGLYPTFRLGWLSTYFCFFETITGIFLMIFYTPAPDIAYQDMVNILGNVPLGQLMRDLHRLGAEAMVLIVSLHMLRSFLTASYKKPRQFTWFSGVVLLLVTLFLSFSGYLLPWDQLSLWAVTIGTSMVEAAPPEVVGTSLNLLARGGPEMNAGGLLRFYLLHVLALPALLFVFLGVHYYKVVIHGPSLPPKSENIGEDTAKRIPLDKRVYYIPDILTSELMWTGVTSLILLVLSIWFFHAPLENHADPQITPLGTTAPWYFLWIQGALKLGDKVFWGLVFPGIVFTLFMVIPYIDVTPSRRFAHRRIAITFAMLIVTATTILSFMGLPKFAVRTSADVEILHEFVFPPAHNNMGRMLPVPYEQLVLGAYTTEQIEAELNGEDPEAVVEEFNLMLEDSGQIEGLMEHLGTVYFTLPSVTFRTVPQDATELHEVLEFFHEELEKHDLELKDGWGAIIITQNQPGLKRVDLVIHWNEVVIEGGDPVIDPETGQPIPVYQPQPVMEPVVDENGQPVLDADGNPVLAPVKDDNGHEIPLLDEAGNPVPLLDENGNPVPKERINSDRVFIHVDSQYFAR